MSLLLCDRNPELAVAVRQACPEYDIRYVPTATDALDVLTEQPPAMLITEMQPPDMDGFAFLSRIRETEANKDLPIIVLTTMEPRLVSERLRQFHVAEVLQKSDLSASLKKAVQHHLAPTSKPQALLFDKSWVQSKLISQFLTSRGVEVTVCSQPESLLSDYETVRPSILMFDVRDCGNQLDGLLRRIASDPDKPKKIVALSSGTEKQLNARLLNSGVDCVLTKPFTIPSVAAALAGVLAKPADGAKASDPPPGRSLLVVEDYPLIAQASYTIFTQSGFRVATARSAEMAFEILKQAQFDAILLDILLPGMDGTEFLATLRREGRNIPCVVITGVRDGDKRRQLEELGIEKLVEKPVNYIELIQYLNELLRSPEPVAAGTPSAREVTA